MDVPRLGTLVRSVPRVPCVEGLPRALYSLITTLESHGN